MVNQLNILYLVLNYLFFFFDSVFSLINCKIYHPKQNLGTMDKSVNRGSKFIDNPLDTSITSRGVGPDQNK